MKAQALGLALIVIGDDRIPRAGRSCGFVFLQLLFSFLSRFFLLPLLPRAFFLPFCEG